MAAPEKGSSSMYRDDALLQRLSAIFESERRKRDDCYREKERATERLRLAKEERKSKQKEVEALKKELWDLEEREPEIEKLEELQREYNDLSREVQFQHTNLISKRREVEDITSKLQTKKSEMASALREDEDSLEKARRPNKRIKPNFNKEKLRSALEDDQDLEEMWGQLPSLIEQNVDDMEEEATNVQRENEELVGILAGYKKRLSEKPNGKEA